jgi:hypothetical protein
MYLTTTFVSTIYSFVILSCTYCICAYSELSNGPSSPRAELSTVRVVHRPSCLRSELSTGRAVYGPSCPRSEVSLCGPNCPTGRVVHGPSNPRSEWSTGRVIHGPSSPRAEWSTGRVVYFTGQVVHGPSCPVPVWSDLQSSVKIHWFLSYWIMITGCRSLVVVLSLSKRKVVSSSPARVGRVKLKTYKIGSDCSFDKSTTFKSENQGSFVYDLINGGPVSY